MMESYEKVSRYEPLFDSDAESSRPNKMSYYIKIAESVSIRSTCLRRKYGAVIVADDVIISTGYNGSPRHSINCTTVGECKRAKLGIPSGERYELCRSVHAEANAIISAPRKDMLGSTLYLVGIDAQRNNYTHIDLARPCAMCARLILNSGINKVVAAGLYQDMLYARVIDTDTLLDLCEI